MGPSQSHQHELASSDDGLSLFVPCHESTSSLASTDQRYDDVLTRNYQKHKNFKACRKLSKLRKSFSECFRSKFQQLKEETDIEQKPDSELISAQRPNSEMSNTVATESRDRRQSDSNDGVCQSFPKDIQEIHHQLNELKRLLSKPEIVNESIDKRDESCQTNKTDMIADHLLRQRDILIANQQDQLNNLRINLENKVKVSESLLKELSILKSQQSRRSTDIDSKVLDQFILLLQSVRSERKLDNCDLDKFDEGINLMTSISISSRSQNEKANVAIINPCSKNSKVLSKFDKKISSSALSENFDQQEKLNNPFISDSKSFGNKTDTKLIYFLGKSPIPYVSLIPQPLSAITLADVKEYTNSVLSKDTNFRYFFKTCSSDMGSSKQEIIRDHDSVPIVDGKIIVFILQ